MEWSFNAKRMVSVIELLEQPDRHSNGYYRGRYLCCFTWNKYS